MAQTYKLRPSELMAIPDEYTAYCFDEACALILRNIEAGEEPIEKTIEKPHYSSPSQLYKKYED